MAPGCSLLDKDFNRNSFELNDPLSWEGSLRSEPVKVRKTRVQHELDEIDDGKYGAYAYWVGDEGVKTKVSVKIPIEIRHSPESKRTTSWLQPSRTYSLNSTAAWV